MCAEGIGGFEGGPAMAHIALPEDAPGIIGPMQAYPETGIHLMGLAEALLRESSSLTLVERELIAAHVSRGNECSFCAHAHAAAARELYAGGRGEVDAALAGEASALLSEKMKALLAIADEVRRDGRLVGAADVARARAAGADDKALHDTVLIAAAFCMFNRYVDGLATSVPRDPEAYRQIGQTLATRGYARGGG
jgi:uncharacterized peroxidase-related enzyme